MRDLPRLLTIMLNVMLMMMTLMVMYMIILLMNREVNGGRGGGGCRGRVRRLFAKDDNSQPKCHIQNSLYHTAVN